MDVAAWLRTLGLEQYDPAFRENKITADLLPSLTSEDLRDIGVVAVGDRRRLLTAIAALQSGPADAAATNAKPVPKPEAERRQVTVMFCDLVGSTVLSTQLDPEDLGEVIGGFQRQIAQTISQFEGFVARYLGDGVLAYFGYPHAHEDDAEQAVRAGLALIDAVGELRAPQRLQVRVGIATGVVVVGDLIGTGSAQEQAIVGETPNLAARLQALAEPDAVVIADSTRRQIGGLFEVHDLGPQSLKGFAEPQRCWRVLSENRALGRFEALRSGATPLVGRDEEMELLLRRWGQAKAGRGRVVLISGEPGIGKSRMADALAKRIAIEPHIRLRYFCSPHHGDSAFYPVIAQMERAARFAPDDSSVERLAKLRPLLGAASPPNEDLALIAQLHSLPSAEFAVPLDLSPQRKKEKTFEALLRQVEGLSRQRPVLMVFEDIHWIDPSSRELLDRTLERILNWPVLLLATFRPEFQPPWIGQSDVTMLALARLDQCDAAAMVACIAGEAALTVDVVQEIAERTDGVPLFVEELTRAVLESDAQTAPSSVPHPALSVPATLHASLMARLDLLGQAAKTVAQAGAVIGREFGYELLGSVADLSEQQLWQALDRLTRSGLLFARGAPPHASYIFKHALVRDAAYGSLLRSRRQGLHRRIAEALEYSVPATGEVQPQLLAYHFVEASSPERAVEYWLKAGQKSVARFAMVEAAALFRKGLEVLWELAESPIHLGQQLEFWIGLGWALMHSVGDAHTETGDAWAAARELCDRLGEVRVPVYCGQCLYHQGRAEYSTETQIADALLKLPNTQGEAIAYGNFWMGCSKHWLGEPIVASEYFERALAAYRPGQGQPDSPFFLESDSNLIRNEQACAAGA